MLRSELRPLKGTNRRGHESVGGENVYVAPDRVAAFGDIALRAGIANECRANAVAYSARRGVFCVCCARE